MAITFEYLTDKVKNIHEATSLYAKGAVNQLLTSRNWAIGYYIVEFEQKGKDRAEYGSHLLDNLSEKIDIKGLDRQMLTSCRSFYNKYPQLCGTVSRRLNAATSSYSRLPAIELPVPKSSQIEEKTSQEQICETVSRKFITDPEILITKLSLQE